MVEGKSWSQSSNPHTSGPYLRKTPFWKCVHRQMRTEDIRLHHCHHSCHHSCQHSQAQLSPAQSTAEEEEQISYIQYSKCLSTPTNDPGINSFFFYIVTPWWKRNMTQSPIKLQLRCFVYESQEILTTAACFHLTCILSLCLSVAALCLWHSV